MNELERLRELERIVRKVAAIGFATATAKWTPEMDELAKWVETIYVVGFDPIELGC